MNCKNCGANITEGTTECPYCGTLFQQQTIKKENNIPEPEKKAETENKAEGLMEKKYAFVSAKGMRIGLFTRIANTVRFSDDRIFITTSPQKCCTAPSVLYEDVTGVMLKTKFSASSILYSLISFVLGFFTVFTFFLIPVFLWCGYNKKITITQRNGNNVVIYSNRGKIADAFREDMKKVCKIQ